VLLASLVVSPLKLFPYPFRYEAIHDEIVICARGEHRVEEASASPGAIKVAPTQLPLQGRIRIFVSFAAIRSIRIYFPNNAPCPEGTPEP
jgi:hypothetical protein